MGARNVEFLDRKVTFEAIAPLMHKIQNFSLKIKLPKSKQAVQRFMGYVNYYRTYIPRLLDKLTPFNILLKSENKVAKTQETPQKYAEISKALGSALQFRIEATTLEKNLILITDASFRSSAYALMTEDNRKRKLFSKSRSLAPKAFGS